MVVPQRAIVRPRVISSFTGETLLLEEEIRELIDRGKKGTFRIVGGPGSGKRTALAHLMAVMPDGKVGLVEENAPDRLVCVESGDADVVPKGTLVYRLAAWQEDEVLEYVLAAHRDRCASIMRRWKAAADRQVLEGNPELCRQVLDLLAADEGLDNVDAALRRLIETQRPTDVEHPDIAKLCAWLRVVCGSVEERMEHEGAVPRPGIQVLDSRPGASQSEAERLVSWFRLIRHRPVLLRIVADEVLRELRGSGNCGFLRMMPPDLIDFVATSVRDDATSRGRLEQILAEGSSWDEHPVAASLLHAAGVGWRPQRYMAMAGPLKWLPIKRRLAPNLAGACLSGAAWPGIDLQRMDLSQASLRQADLSGAKLNKVRALHADFSGAKLVGASLKGLTAAYASFAGADLSNADATKAILQFASLAGATFAAARLQSADFLRANLERATFVAADLSGATLMVATIAGADFTRANLTGAFLLHLPLRTAEFRQCCFREAHLSDADLEGMSLPGVDFHGADLKGALLTSSFMPGADFRGAKLVNTGLAEIEWERADLRDADLRGATFHMGSSRSGLVDSAIASYGTRTGFYTDDSLDQDYKAPEEIRKANLRGADLRGANIDGVDFYLVDLRDARYDADQERQFRATGAILEPRVK